MGFGGGGGRERVVTAVRLIGVCVVLGDDCVRGAMAEVPARIANDLGELCFLVPKTTVLYHNNRKCKKK